MPLPVIPEYITVHLGAPDAPAENIRVPFTSYIKNVASSEIYPTWPESAIRANVLAQISFALNRIYTEYYRSRGYDFDITNNTQYDQKFIKDRDFFENISHIVDDVFNNYVVRQGDVEPLFTQYCNGTTVVCDGMSQWGTVELAEQGFFPYEILQYYYGDDINIMTNTPVQGILESYPGIPLRLGSAGEEVRTIQRQLNRIAVNYPAIPRIQQTNGIFDIETQNAVLKFQEIFDLTVDGVVGKSTWYKIKLIYNGIKGLSELVSEGLAYSEVERLFASELKEGDTGTAVGVLQHYLLVIGAFHSNLPVIRIDNIFGPETRNAVIAFQREYGLPQTGVVNRDTWNQILRVYDQILASAPPNALEDYSRIYPGRFLSSGVSGEEVTRLQQFINRAADNYAYIPHVPVTGIYDNATEAAVRAVQANNDIPLTGAVGPLTWDQIVFLAGLATSVY